MTHSIFKMRDDFLVFGAPKIETAEIEEVIDSLKSGWLGTGPKVHKFEQMFSEYKNVKYALAVNSCTAALHLAMLATGIGPGDEVIVPTMTFAATANSVIHSGAKPVFVDCQKDTMNIDPVDIERKISPKTRAIIPVHFAGLPCDMDAIMEIARKYNLFVIEDAAHAVEAEYKGRKIGTIGDIGCFSFYVTKNIITGEGGMAITENEEYANKIKIMALHGMSKDAWKRFSDDGYKHYQVMYAGFKYNMMDIQAALGIHQLPRVDRYWVRRKEIWEIYNEAFKNLPMSTPSIVQADCKHSYHLYTLILDTDHLSITRDQFMEAMTQQNIGVGVHYIALHLHPFYQEKFGYKPNDFPNATWISCRTVSIPLSVNLNDKDVDDVSKTVKGILS